MASEIKLKNALISVFYKDGLEPIVKKLHECGVRLYSTGGTQSFIENLGIPVVPVEELTSYPSILGGRVKTLHPKIFGGILSRRDNESDQKEVAEFEIPDIDLVIVDLYPFEETVASGGTESEIIEKIDIGGISLIRAAAKNHKDCWIVPSKDYYGEVLEILEARNGVTSFEQRREFATYSFNESSHYDTAIYKYFNPNPDSLKISYKEGQALRYGENPHQKGTYFGKLDDILEQLHGKALSYNNLLDVDASVQLINEFEDTTVAIIKHNNACGLASRNVLVEAWKDALAGDPVSAFGGVLIANRKIDLATAEEMNKIFCEVVIAPDYNEDALALLKSKKNRIILKLNDFEPQEYNVRTLLNGVLVQERDHKTDNVSELKNVTKRSATAEEIDDLIFASKICKNTKSNTIVLAKNKQLLASGTGQTSRVDALNQSIHKAKTFNFDLNGAVMASDAFFPFPDCVEIAHIEGVNAVIQPGGSIKDQHSIDYCDANNMAMVYTGTRHFKH